MTSLKEARAKGRIEQFVEEHEAEATPANAEAFDLTLASMAGKSKAAPKASMPDNRDD